MYTDSAIENRPHITLSAKILGDFKHECEDLKIKINDLKKISVKNCQNRKKKTINFRVFLP